MTEPDQPRPRASRQPSTATSDAPSYFTSQPLRNRPSSLRQTSTPSPQQPLPTLNTNLSPTTHASPPTTSIHQTSSQQQQPPALPNDSTLRPRRFSPLFTLVTDTTTTPPRTHHPRVHYIFTDDDDSVLASALEAAASTLHNTASPDSTVSAASIKGARGERRDRAVVLDLVEGEAGGWDVKTVGSLGSDWAVTGASVGRMEGDGPASGEEGEGPLVLKIEGVGVEGTPGLAAGKAPAEGRDDAQGEGGYANMMEEFEKKMGTLRKVVAALDERERVVAEEDAEREREGQGNEAEGEERIPWEEAREEQEGG